MSDRQTQQENSQEYDCSDTLKPKYDDLSLILKHPDYFEGYLDDYEGKKQVLDD